MNLAQDLYFQDDLKENPVGDFTLVEGDEAERQSILIRLKTPKGSNSFHPWYGNGIFDILSENIDETWLYRATEHIRECVEQDSKIKAVKILPEISYEERRVSFHITYKGSGTTNTLTWGENIG